ncbi:hypothetical protein SNEBB_004276 [Seison nebaliae]|nr:hypothetical protein SNEBB_004276 [Seison nebaliae]
MKNLLFVCFHTVITLVLASEESAMEGLTMKSDVRIEQTLNFGNADMTDANDLVINVTKTTFQRLLGIDIDDGEFNVTVFEKHGYFVHYIIRFSMSELPTDIAEIFFKDPKTIINERGIADMFTSLEPSSVFIESRGTKITISYSNPLEKPSYMSAIITIAVAVILLCTALIIAYYLLASYRRKNLHSTAAIKDTSTALNPLQKKTSGRHLKEKAEPLVN